MIIYTNIEERYCTHCSRNVGVEYTHMEDGSVVKRCLSKSCGEIESGRECFFNSVE